MKKRHVFYIIYLAVTVICTVAALVLNPVHGGMYHGVVYPVYGDTSSAMSDIMLAISGILIVVGFLFFVIAHIKKIIISKINK